MKFLFLALFAFNLPTSFAKPQRVAKYFDCMSSTNFITDRVPVFVKVNGKKMKETFAASLFTKGIDISLTTKSNGDIEQITLGNMIKFSVEDFENGIEFGVFNKSAHTIQLVDFNPSTGGVVEFGYLKDVLASKKDFKSQRSLNINENYRALYGNNWGVYKVFLARDPATNAWRMHNEKSDTIRAIFGFLKQRNRFMVQGISGMDVLTENHTMSQVQCPK